MSVLPTSVPSLSTPSITSAGTGQYTISTNTLQPPSQYGSFGVLSSVDMGSIQEAMRLAETHKRLILTTLVGQPFGYGVYRFAVGLIPFELRIERQNDTVCVVLTEQSTFNSSRRTLSHDELFRVPLEQLVTTHLPTMLTDICVFLKLEYKGP